MNGAHSRIVALCVLLLPAFLLGGFSLWLFAAKWIGLVVVIVGVAIAALGSRSRLAAGAIAIVAVVEIGMLLATMVVGFVIDCSRHCS